MPSKIRVAAAFVAALTSLGTLCAAPGGHQPGWRTYTDAQLGYTISYPPGWQLDTRYAYTGFGPGKEIRGVAIHIPPSIARGTNLSPNLTAVSIESVPGICRVDRFLEAPYHLRSFEDAGVAYSAGDGGDAGAGNIYQQVVYVIAGSKPCLAIRYFIHSTNIGNYDRGTVRAFDSAALLAQFDRIRRTLVLRQRARRPAGPR